jgi:hypothetical protein
MSALPPKADIIRATESASEAERRERLGLWIGDISLMPNGTLDGFNHVLDFDQGLTHVFCVSAIVFFRQSFRDVASVRNLTVIIRTVLFGWQAAARPQSSVYFH